MGHFPLWPFLQQWPIGKLHNYHKISIRTTSGSIKMQNRGLGTITGIGIIVEISAEMGTITTMPLANVPNGNTMRMGEKDFIVHSFTSFYDFFGGLSISS